MKQIRSEFAQLRRIFSVATVFAVLVPVTFAQAAQTADDASAAAKTPSASTAPTQVKALARPSAISSSSAEVLVNVTIAPGQAAQFDSQIDYSSSDSVRVTVRSANPDLANLVVSAYWAIPDAPTYNAGEVMTGDKFFYSTTGGATFNTFGNQFRLRLTNTGTTPMSLSQVTVYARIY